MQHDHAARCLEALGSQHRLAIYRLLVTAGPEGRTVGDVREHLGMAPSTLSHHIAKLVNEGLISQERESRNLICCCNYSLMEELLGFLTENCCRGESRCEAGSNATHRTGAIAG